MFPGGERVFLYGSIRTFRFKNEIKKYKLARKTHDWREHENRPTNIIILKGIFIAVKPLA